MAKATRNSSPGSTVDSGTPENDSETPPPPGSNKKSKSTRTPLSEVQKSTNHKDAENKRRNAIREQFTELSNLVPGTEGQQRSEHLMLQATVDFLKEQTMKARELEQEITAHGGQLPLEEMMRDDEWGGPDFVPRNVMEHEAAKVRRTVGRTDSSDGVKGTTTTNGVYHEE